jgi:hypothetical protein
MGMLDCEILAGFALQFVLTFVLNNWWEEVACAGFVGPQLQKRYDSTVQASLIAAFVQAISAAAAPGGRRRVPGGRQDPARLPAHRRQRGRPAGPARTPGARPPRRGR